VKAVGPRIVVRHGRQVAAQRDAIEFIVPEARFITAERHLRLMSSESIGELIGQIEEELQTLS
jgi:hypothetical protein